MSAKLNGGGAPGLKAVNLSLSSSETTLDGALTFNTQFLSLNKVLDEEIEGNLRSAAELSLEREDLILNEAGVVAEKGINPPVVLSGEKL
jgi:hypothetical protein